MPDAADGCPTNRGFELAIIKLDGDFM